MCWMGGGWILPRLVCRMLTRIFSFPRCSNSASDDLGPSLAELPADVKEGHFVVRTLDDGEPKRFIIELEYSAYLGFIKLLELAEEEYGFTQVGVLTVPCGSNELPRILENSEGGTGKSIQDEKQEQQARN